MKKGPGVARVRPWQAARPGAATARQSSADELFTIVAFDVPSDKARKKLGDLCKDYGLTRAQWSVFEGTMTRNRREELFGQIEHLLATAEGGGRVVVHPIGQRELAWAQRCVTRGAPVAKVGA